MEFLVQPIDYFTCYRRPECEYLASDINGFIKFSNHNFGEQSIGAMHDRNQMSGVNCFISGLKWQWPGPGPGPSSLPEWPTIKKVRGTVPAAKCGPLSATL